MTENNKKPQQGGIGLWLYRVINGILVGGGAILPGVSGGVLCVVFGIYQPMMAILSRPFTAIKQYWRLFLPVMIGVVIGFIGFAKVLGDLFDRYETQMLWLFIGLILGTVPMLLKTARHGEGLSASSKKDWTALVLAFALLFGFLMALKYVGSMSLTLTPVWGFISGIIWRFSLVVPGMSSSSILIFMGLYKDIMSAVGALNLGVVVPLIAGIFLVAILFAKFVDRLFDKHFSLVSHAVVGLVIASTLTIIPAFSGLKQLAFGLGLAVIGFVAALFLDKWQAKMRPAE